MLPPASLSQAEGSSRLSMGTRRVYATGGHLEFGPRWPNVLFFHSRIEREHSSQGVFVRRGKTDPEFVSEILALKTNNHPFGRTFPLQPNSLAARPKYARRSPLLGNRSRKMTLDRATDQHERVVEIRLTASIGTGQNVDGLKTDFQVTDRSIALDMKLFDHCRLGYLSPG